MIIKIIQEPRLRKIHCYIEQWTCTYFSNKIIFCQPFVWKTSFSFHGKYFECYQNNIKSKKWLFFVRFGQLLNICYKRVLRVIQASKIS